MIFSGEAEASLAISCRGQVIAELGPEALGPVRENANEPRNRQVWEVGVLNVASCEFDRIDDVVDNVYDPVQQSCPCPDCTSGPCADCGPDDQCIDNECVGRCDDVDCGDGLQCDPRNGACVECFNDRDCGGREICIDGGICDDGSGRDYSPWPDDGADHTRCQSDDDCTADELCYEGINDPLGSVCYLPCGNGQACPEGFVCCDIPGDGIRGGIFCATPNSIWGRQRCGR